MNIVGIDIGGTKTSIGIVDIKKALFSQKQLHNQKNIKMLKK